MRTLAIDLGTKRVGLALSDEGARFATPLDVIQADFIPQVLRIVAEQGVLRIVVGLPLNMDGSVGPAARTTIAWAKKLSALWGKPVLFVDERLSSFAAEQSIIERKRGGEKITRKARKQRLDALAAADFLQAFLDGKLHPIEVNE